MTPERARELAEPYAVNHAAAAPLLLQWVQGATAEERARAGLALAVLDPLVPLSREASSWLMGLLYTEAARALMREVNAA